MSMRTLVVIEFLSLDGVMQSLGGPDEDTEGGFRHGGWSQPYMDGVLQQASLEGMKSTDAYLFGRRTYEKFVQFWPTQPDENPMAAHLNGTPKYVASSTLDRVEWRNASLLDGDVPDAVRALKARDGGSIAVLGSGVLVKTLFEHELVDELRLFIHPLIIGSGKRLFPESPTMRPVELIDVTPTTTGVLMARYRLR
jgi:dihydrofolate reductase